MSLFVATDTDTLAANTAETIIQVVAATKPLRIKEVGVSFNGVDAAQIPILVELMRQTTAGTSASGTVREQEEVRESPLASSLINFTAEPTAGDILRQWYVPPAGGLFVMQFPLGDEPVVGPSGRMGLRCTPSGASNTPGVAAYIVFDE